MEARIPGQGAGRRVRNASVALAAACAVAVGGLAVAAPAGAATPTSGPAATAGAGYRHGVVPSLGSTTGATSTVPQRISTSRGSGASSGGRGKSHTDTWPGPGTTAKGGRSVPRQRQWSRVACSQSGLVMSGSGLGLGRRAIALGLAFAGLVLPRRRRRVA